VIRPTPIPVDAASLFAGVGGRTSRYETDTYRLVSVSSLPVHFIFSAYS